MVFKHCGRSLDKKIDEKTLGREKLIELPSHRDIWAHFDLSGGQ